MKRAADALGGETFDLAIIGGGITGAGVALDAATRGLRVALIDKGDFASGTSSVSSKLVHGGLRYLEHYRFQLVREALDERGLLLKNAPHLVTPLRFVLPYYKTARIPPWKWRLGLTLYDLFAGRHNIRRSMPSSAPALHGAFPDLRVAELVGGVEYYDAQMDDARVVIDVLQTAAGFGAVLANYVEARGFEMRQGEIAGIHALDRVGGKHFLLRARQVVNASGPWVDAVCRLAGDTQAPYLQPSKGAHIILPGRELAAALLLLHPRDGRVFFVIPWLGKTLVGTTDTYTSAGPDALALDDGDVAYLLEGHNHYFNPALEAQQVMGAFVGLRPLLRGRPGEPSSMSREFRLIASPSGLLSAAGGKFTTYRGIAERITNEVARRLRLRSRLCRTGDLPLDGAPRGPWQPFFETALGKFGRNHALSAAVATHLLRRYGRRAFDVVGCMDEDAALARPIHRGEPEVEAELVYQRNHEMAVYAEDSWLRRTRLGLYRPELLGQGRPEFPSGSALQAHP